MQIKNINLGKKVIWGIEIPLPNAMLIMAVAPKGFVMCGYLDISMAEKLGDCAAIVHGVKSIDDLLSAKVAEVTAGARKKGIRTGMTARAALLKM